jgi:two-component system, response regulator / RNA-binding antiterminator
MADEPDPRGAAVLYARGRAGDDVHALLAGLGYEVRLCEEGADELSWRTDGLEPAVAVVGMTEPPERAFALIGRLAHEAVCPVVAIVPDLDTESVREAARRGAFGVVLETDLAPLGAVVDVARARFTQYSALQDAFARRATVEQAKGILMAQHGIDQDAAFDLLRRHARKSSTKVVTVAEAIVRSHALLAGPGRTPAARRPPAPAA